ncbi:MAG: hypothetical protein CSA15_08580 [Candidatus Delongbacteria bacterium]|nr:MAG: hypothetical protein CSA15_08580 [Candidatus Delongbacteria bacterium]
MKFTIDFEKEINSMLKSNIGLCPYFRKNNHRFLERYWDMDYFYNRHFHSKYFHRFLSKNGISYLRNLLKDESSFENPLFYLLFKAFVYAEIKFIVNYIPQNSHEERLTGHLISEIANSLNIINETFEQKAFELYQSKVELDFHYADLSSNNREKYTGADLGLIFHVNLPDYQEKVNVAIIQSKKFDKRASIDLRQIETLKKFAEESGYYCFYDMNRNDRTSPLIQKANSITSILNNDIENMKTKSLMRNDITERYNGGIPLSIFFIFDMLNPENESVKSFSNIWEAKSFIDNRNRDFRLSRVLTVSVGGISKSNQDLRNISDLFSFENYRDEE